MTVYKYFIKIALKNKGVILSYTIIFFILSILNGSSNAQREISFTETKFIIGIVDNSNSEISRNLTDYLGKKNKITFMDADEDYIKEQVFLQVVDAVIIIPEDFNERIVNKKNAIELFRDDRNIASYQIENQINKFISFANATYENGEFDLLNVGSALDKSVDVNLIESEDNVNQKVNTWFKFYFNFVSYIIMALYIAVIGYVMTEFIDEEIENRRKVSSIRFLKFNKEIYLGQLTIASLITMIFIMGSMILRGKYIGEVDFLKYVVNTIVFSFSALCLVFLINNITHNKYIISGVSTVLSLGTSFISGVMVPQQFLGEKVLTIAKFFPTYYFVKINEMNINSFLDVKYEIFMQLLFAIVFLLMGLYFSKTKQKV
ncbi:ABC transporter permease [Tissierella pigra]|uniref:ABC transporter permease n=1 Tax=Tissierella pigra TaxID=2607614 RepID=A0A6N7Y146_9FIRM|nr:ABC transporter permease [Tissierella pigra]MBU5428281.1 ABC transporter permease [Tissierella pigra]MSU03463.1 ABC transporter permease [Tissierella pigra]